MAKVVNNEVVEQDFEQEIPDNPITDITKVITEGDPDTMLAVMRRKAAMAKEWANLINTILLTQTYPEDWKEFSGKVCLSSAGAERIARMFNIKYFEVTSKKEEFSDQHGKGYRYIYEGNAEMNGRIIFVMGVYSTRDKFLGFAKDEWKDIAEINENDIRTAAYHRFCGNAVKSLLGLRGMPKERFDAIFASAGENTTNKTTKVSYANGTKGGTDADDQIKQAELGRLLLEIANAGYDICIDDDGTHSVQPLFDQGDPIEIAKSSCKNLTSFKGKDGKLVQGLDSAKAVKGQRLEIALNKAKTLWAGFKKAGQ